MTSSKQGMTAYPATVMQLSAGLILLMIIWLLWSGFFKPLLIGLGVFSCVLSLWLAKRTGFFRSLIPLRTLTRLPALWWWVLTDVVKSSFSVARIVLSPSLPIQPELVEFKTSEQSAMGRVIIGNAITLSPGTVTINVDDDRLLVHCLTTDSADSIRSREAERRTARLELR